MGQSEESPSQLPGLFGPTLIVAIGGLVAYFTIEPALESRRPDLSKNNIVPPPPSVPGLNAVHGRLWDDPLALAYEDSRRKPRDVGKFPPWLRALARRAVCLNETQSDVHRYFETIVRQFLKGDQGTFLCLPVLVRGEPYDSDTEDRKRITYAVLSALESCGYALSVPDRVSYVELPVVVDIPAVKESVCVERFVVPVKLFQRSNVPRSIPQSEGPDGVLMLWINEDQLGRRPLAAIGQILEGFFKAPDLKKRIEIRILGPTDSNTLLDMAQEDAIWESESCENAKLPRNNACCAAKTSAYFSTTYANHPTLYSGRATISEWALRDTIDRSKSQSPLSKFTDGTPTHSGLSVVRTIGSDWQLVQLLARELKLRGAWPLTSDKAHSSDCVREEPLRHIVLVTESDTLYGRALPAVFQEAYARLLKTTGSREGQDEGLLHVFTYLRGLDGKVPGDKNQPDQTNDEKKKSETSDSDPLASPHPESIPPSGRSQFDYLRRLEQELVEIDARSRDAGEAGITAIGVVGTDIYDKLLILRALRKRFPRTWFFSTDLDAALSLPSEYPTTRNLIVASHFGLTLNPRLQRSALPFRDAYETSTYFSALLALDDDAGRSAVSNSPDPWNLRAETGKGAVEVPGLSPLVFEIGRNGPYQLTIPTKDESSGFIKDVHPPGLRKRHWLNDPWRAWGLAGLVLLAGAGVWCLSKEAREETKLICCGWRWADSNVERFVLRLLIIVIVGTSVWLIYSAVSDHTNPSGEPFVIFEGISIWPATIVRFLALVLSAAFIARVFSHFRGELQTNLDNLWKGKPPTAAAESECGKALGDFCKLACARLYLWWSLAPAVAFLVFCWLLVMLTERPPSPYRGHLSAQWQACVVGFAVPAMTYLTFLVIAHLEYCRRFVKGLGEMAADWSPTEMQQLDQQRQPIDRADLGEWLTVRIIAESTEAVGNLVKFPFIVLFVMICSRHPALDKLELPWSLVAIWALIVAALSWMAHTMRRDAREARDDVLDRLRDALSLVMNSGANPLLAALRAQQLRQYISEIQTEDRGAFRPLIRDPLVQALTLGTSGGLMLVHQLLPYV